MIRQAPENRSGKRPAATRPALLQRDGEGWRVGGVGPGGLVVDEADADLSTLGDGRRPPRLVLALPSGEWLCGGISTDALPRRGRAAAMLYRLEEKLPVAAEELSAAFVETDGRALGVATDAGDLRELIDPLAAAGVRVVCVTPLPLLALQGKPASAETDVLVWQNGAEAEVFGLSGGRPTSWATLPADAVDVGLHLRLLGDGRDRPVAELRVELRDVSPELAEGMAVADVEACVTATDGLPLCAVAGAAKVQAGEPPLADVAPGLPSLAPGGGKPAVTAVLAAGCLLLAATAGALLLRASQYGDLVRVREAALRTQFKGVFPQERVPPASNIRRRLEIEARGLGGGDAGAVETRSALNLSAAVLAGLPADVRFRLFELRVGPAELYLDGQARSFADADAVAAGLRDVAGFDVGSPVTEQTDPQTVSFRITALAAEAKGRP